MPILCFSRCTIGRVVVLDLRMRLRGGGFQSHPRLQSSIPPESVIEYYQKLWSKRAYNQSPSFHTSGRGQL